MTHHCNSKIFLTVALQKELEFVSPLSDISWRFEDPRLEHISKYCLYSLLITFLLVVMDNCLVFSLVLFTIVFDKPKFTSLLNLLKIIKRVPAFFITKTASKITSTSQPFRKNGLNYNRASRLWKDFIARLQRPIQGWNQYNIWVIVLQYFLGFHTLNIRSKYFTHALLGNITI